MKTQIYTSCCSRHVADRMFEFIYENYRPWNVIEPKAAGSNTLPAFDRTINIGQFGKHPCRIGYDMNGAVVGVESWYAQAIVRWIALRVGTRRPVPSAGVRSIARYYTPMGMCYLPTTVEDATKLGPQYKPCDEVGFQPIYRAFLAPSKTTVIEVRILSCPHIGLTLQAAQTLRLPQKIWDQLEASLCHPPQEIVSACPVFLNQIIHVLENTSCDYQYDMDHFDMSGFLKECDSADLEPFFQACDDVTREEVCRLDGLWKA